MAAISAALVKELRDRTGAGMMECKSALTEANGDLSEAEIVLRKRGTSSAAKKASRTAKQGIIGSQVSDSGQSAVLVEVNCESDFVARTPDFQELVQQLTAHVASTHPKGLRRSEGETGDDQNYLYDQFIGAEGQTVEQFINSKIQKTGENIAVSRFATFTIPVEQSGVVGIYLHPGSQLGVMVELITASPLETGEELRTLVKDVAMQIAAADPQFLRREDVTSEALEREKDIQRSRALAEGKPEKVADKIVEGRMNKYYEEVCLTEQPFVKDNTVTIGQLIDSKTNGHGRVTRFARFKVGDMVADKPEAE